MATESMLRPVEIIRSKRKCKAFILACEAAKKAAEETDEEQIAFCEDLRGEELRKFLNGFLSKH